MPDNTATGPKITTKIDTGWPHPHVSMCLQFPHGTTSDQVLKYLERFTDVLIEVSLVEGWLL